jgi:signal transduction histidine kinase
MRADPPHTRQAAGRGARTPGARTLVRQLVVVAAYAATAWVCLKLPGHTGLITPVWVPSGVVLALMLLWGPWMAIGVGVADIAVNIVVNHLSAGTSLGLAVGDVVDPLLAVWALGTMRFDLRMRHVRDVVLLFGTGAASATVSATVGTAVLRIAGHIPASGIRDEWLTYWASVAVGYTLLAPLLLAWVMSRETGGGRAGFALSRRARSRGVLWTGAEAVACAAAMAAVSAGAFLGNEWRVADVLLLFPALTWATLRFGMRGATGSIVLVAGIAVWGTVRESVLLPGVGATETVRDLQLMLAAVALGNLVMSLVLADRDDAVAAAEHTTRALRRAQTLANMGSWELDIASGRMSWSDELVRLLWPPGVMVPGAATVGKLLTRVHSDDRVRVRKVIRAALREHHGFEVEHRVQPPDAGTAVRTVAQSGIVLVGADGTLERMVVSVLDVSERRSVARLQDELIATASHDLRSPLTSIVGFAETLLERWDALGERERVQMVRIVHDEGQRMNEFVEDALMQSRVDADALVSDVQILDVEALVERAVRECGVPGVATDCEPDALVWADADQLVLVLRHLLVNAARHGDPPIRVAVRSRAAAVAGGEDRVTIEVSDAGPGVPIELRDELFSRFARTRLPGTPGTGLGLSIVRGIVERLAGTVTYRRDDAAARSVFVVELDAAHDPEPSPVLGSSAQGAQ